MKVTEIPHGYEAIYAANLQVGQDKEKEKVQMERKMCFSGKIITYSF